MGSRRASAVSHNERYRVRHDCDKRYKRGWGLSHLSLSCRSRVVREKSNSGKGPAAFVPLVPQCIKKYLN
nr:MAG TPA: hypothetical protein [Caudoviricetes sp.]